MSLTGNLEDLGLGDIFQIVNLSRKSGVLSLKRPGREGRVVFLHGDIVLAFSSEHPEPFSQIIAQSEIASQQTIQAAIDVQARMPKPARLAEILSRRFGVPHAAVDSVLRRRVRKIARSFFDWTEGRYAFEVKEDFDPSSSYPEPHYGVLERGLSPRDLFREGDPQAEVVSDSGSQAGGASLLDLGSEVLQEKGRPNPSAHTYTSAGLPLLKSMLQELHNPSLGGGIVLLVLRFASEFMNRAVVFLVKEEEIVGIGQFGIEAPQAGRRGRRMCFPLGEESPFCAVLEQRMPAKIRLDETRWCRSFREALGGAVSEEVFVGPILSEGKPVALLYGDNFPAGQEIGDTESLEIFLSQAGMAMEKALLERKLQGGLR